MAARGEFSSQTAFILAASGSAVGLGNIWGFPYSGGVQRWRGVCFYLYRSDILTCIPHPHGRTRSGAP